MFPIILVSLTLFSYPSNLKKLYLNVIKIFIFNNFRFTFYRTSAPPPSFHFVDLYPLLIYLQCANSNLNKIKVTKIIYGMKSPQIKCNTSRNLRNISKASYSFVIFNSNECSISNHEYNT